MLCLVPLALLLAAGCAKVLFYATSGGDGEEDVMPLTIVGGRLVGWGRLDYESATRPTDGIRWTN